MIIDKDGNINRSGAWARVDGPAIEHFNPTYNMTFNICLPYNDEQKALYLQVRERKRMLNATDYKALKYADGAYTEEEYAPIKAERARWRAEINQIEKTFHEPTLTDDEIAEAERKAMENLKAMLESQSGKEIELIKGGG